MKKEIILSLFFILCAISSSAQKVGDTISIFADTINIHGKVIDQDRNPIGGAELFAIAFGMHSRYHNGYRKTLSDKTGFFTLKGIKPIDTIFIYTKFGKEIIVNNGSRNLTIVVREHKIINYDYPSISINAKRKNKKPKIKLNLIYSGSWPEPENLYDEPEYPGSKGKLWKFIENNIKYPDIAVENSIEGIVVLEFTVDGRGNVKDIEIIRDIGYGCGEEAMRVIKSSKRWNPAMQNGRPIERRISMQIPFCLIE